MHHTQSLSDSSVYDFLQDAQEFLEATLQVEKLSLVALEHRSRLMTKLSALLKDDDGHQAEMYIDMSPTLKLTFKAFDSSASENSSLRESQTVIEQLYELPPDCDDLDCHPLNKGLESNLGDECDGRDAEIAAAIANAPLPKKKKGFIQRLFRTPSKVATFQKSPLAQRRDPEDGVKKDAEVTCDVHSSTHAKIQEGQLGSSRASVLYDEAVSSLNESMNAIYDDVYSYETNSPLYIGSAYQDCEPGKFMLSTSEAELNNAKSSDGAKSLEAKENSINKEFDIGNMQQEVFDEIGIDADLYDDATACVVKEVIPQVTLSTYENMAEEAVQCDEHVSVAGESVSPESINGDIDNVSLKSATSDYANYNQGWIISVPEAIKQAIHHGPAKRKNGKKLLSAWRRCYCVLIPTHLLMYADEGDQRPRIVIDLTQPGMEVKKLMKQGSDTKRLKLFPFVVTYENKPLYEICTKTREEAEKWVTSLQAVLSRAPTTSDELQAADQQTDESASIYDDVGTPAKISDTKTDQDRIGIIQGRDLPSLPPRAESAKSSFASKPSLSSLNSLSTCASVGNVKTEVGSYGEIFTAKQSNDDLSGDDFYQELHSPSRTGTPYSSIESIQSTGDDADNMYNSIENMSEGRKAEVQPNKGTRSRVCSEVFNWPPPPPDEDELPVYDIPAAAPRPIAVSGSQNIFRYSAADLPEEQELYDVPVTSPRPIPAAVEKEAEHEALEAYDQITTPPRPIVANSQNKDKETSKPQTAAGENQSKPADSSSQEKALLTKTARFWHDKINANNKKDTLPAVKCLPQPQPQPQTEAKSVGRSFSRLSPPRAPLASLTDLLSSSNGGLLKPSVLKKNLNGIHSAFAQTRKTEEKDTENNRLQAKPVLDKNKLPSIILDNNPNQKKEKPPRPPAPVRTIPIQKAGEASSLLAELKRRQMAPKVNQSVKENEKAAESERQPEPITTEKTVPEISYGQYKARWAYVASNITELSINSGEVVEVLGKNGPCWLVRTRNKKGLVPKEYFVPVESDSLHLPTKCEMPIAV